MFKNMSNSFVGFNLVQMSLYRKLDQIACLYKLYDIICCTETWLDDNYTTGMLEIPNMVMYRLDRLHKRGGGVCIYVAIKWAKYIKLVNDLTCISPNFEIITLSLIKPAFRMLQISCLYRPPTGNVD